MSYSELVQIGEKALIADNVELGINGLPLRIGDNCIIRSGTKIYGDVVIGDLFVTGHDILIRDNTRIGTSVSIGSKTIIEGNCLLGDRINIQSQCNITWGTRIEDGVFIGPGVFTTNDKYPPLACCNAPYLADNCSIGAGVILLPGVVIGEGTLIGAGSVVTKDMPPNKIAKGIPCKVLRDR